MYRKFRTAAFSLLLGALISAIGLGPAWGAGFYEQGQAPAGGYPSVISATLVGTHVLNVRDNVVGTGSPRPNGYNLGAWDFDALTIGGAPVVPSDNSAWFGGKPIGNPAYTDQGRFSDVLSRGPLNDVQTYTSLAAAIAAIGSTDNTLMISTPCIVTDNLTIPANVHLLFTKAGRIAPVVNKVVTINGYTPPCSFQIFSGAGTILFGSGAVPEVWANWWGATADAVRTPTSATGTNSAPAFQAAIVCAEKSGVKVVRYAHGNYYWASTVTIGTGSTESGTKLYGPSMAHQINTFSGYITGAAGLTRLLDIGGGGSNALSATVDGVFFLGYTGGPTTAIEFTSHYNGPVRPMKVTSCYITGFTNGIASTYALAAGRLTVQFCVIIGNAYGIRGTVSNAFLMTEILSSIIEQNTTAGISGYFSSTLHMEDLLLEGQPNAIDVSGGLIYITAKHLYFELNTGFLINATATNAGSKIKLENNQYINCVGKFISINAMKLDLQDDLDAVGVKISPASALYGSHIKTAMYPADNTTSLAVSLDVDSIIGNSLSPLSPTNYYAVPAISGDNAATPLGRKTYVSITTNSPLWDSTLSVAAGQYVAVTGFARRPVGSTATGLVLNVYDNTNTWVAAAGFGGSFFKAYGQWEPLFMAVPIAAATNTFRIRLSTESGGTFDATDWYVYTQPATSAFWPYMPNSGW